jgi:hypothetical protein
MRSGVLIPRNGLPEPQIVARELADRRAAHQFHVPLDFGPHEAESPLNTSLAGRSQRIEIAAANAYGLSADGEGLEHMAPALDTAIHEHVDAITHSIDDLGKLVE